MSSVRSMDMNKSAKALGAARNGNRKKRKATKPAATVPTSIGSIRLLHNRRSVRSGRAHPATMLPPPQAAGNSESERVGERDREYPPPPNLSQPRVMNHVMAEMTTNAPK